MSIKSLISSVVNAVTGPQQAAAKRIEKRLSDAKRAINAQKALEAAERRERRNSVYGARRCNTKGLPKGMARHQLVQSVRLEAAAITGRLGERYSEAKMKFADQVLTLARRVRGVRHQDRVRGRRPSKTARRVLTMRNSCRPSLYVATLKATREARGF